MTDEQCVAIMAALLMSGDAYIAYENGTPVNPVEAVRNARRIWQEVNMYDLRAIV